MTSLKLTLYDADNEVIGTFTRTFVPWGMLKKAIKLSKDLDPQNMTEENADELSALVVEVFGDKFTVDQLNKGADIGEMMTVLTGIMSMVAVLGPGHLPNPPPQKQG